MPTNYHLGIWTVFYCNIWTVFFLQPWVLYVHRSMYIEEYEKTANFVFVTPFIVLRFSFEIIVLFCYFSSTLQFQWILRDMSINLRCTKNEVFHQGFLQEMLPNPQFPADLITFTEEILNGKLHFLCSTNDYIQCNIC